MYVLEKVGIYRIFVVEDSFDCSLLFLNCTALLPSFTESDRY